MVKVIHCAEGENFGELQARQYLEKNLRDGIILSNYYHPDCNGTLEIDLLVINARGVWLLEVKDWYGRIKADPIDWLQENGRKEPSPITKIDNKVKKVYSALKDMVPDISVEGFVVLVKGSGALQSNDTRQERVFGLNDTLLEALTGCRFVHSRYSPSLSASQVEQVAKALVERKVDPEDRIIGSYRIVGDLPSADDYQMYEGQHIDVKSRRAHIKRYHIAEIESKKHLEEIRKRFKQAMEALTQLDDHPNIIRAFDFLPDRDSADTYWLILEYIDGKTLQDQLREKRLLSLAVQMDILIPVADALHYCHQHEIVHRNLTPHAIYFIEGGKVKISDFDYARVPAVGTISKPGQPLVTSKYAAPEQTNDPRTADYHADLYSLGAIWYDMNGMGELEDPILVHKIDQMALSPEARDLMRKLLQPQPHARPQSAAEVKEWFELLKG